MSNPRQFSHEQRMNILHASGGVCQSCGVELDENWHADHIIPYSKGGPTTIANGRALCPECNQRKSDSMIIELPRNKTPRDWQVSFWEDWITKDKKSYLLGACPGSGKSWAAAGVAQYLMANDIISRVIVLSPGVDKKNDWANDLSAFGVKSTPNWRGDVYNLKGYKGFSLTYSALTHLPDGSLAKLAKVPTLVIYDEVHHLTDEQAWGEIVESELQRPSVRVLSLTGTPFRSDDHKISFVKYEDGVAQLDFKYDYADALSDEGVVRHCNFKMYGGNMRWDSPTTGEGHQASFEDDLPNESLKSQRLRCAIDPSNQYLKEPLQEAHERLMQIRSNGHPDAGGLIVANREDQIRGRNGPGIIDLVEEVTGTRPVKITSNTDEASARLDEFRESSEPWVVAINMISEGVDVKRLRVGLYASAVTTSLYIHQVVGRVIRWQDEVPKPQESWFWFPLDPRIEPDIENIREMAEHEVDPFEDDDPPTGDHGPQDTLPFIPHEAEATDAKLSSTRLDHLDELSPEALSNLDPEVLTEYIMQLRGDDSGSSIEVSSTSGGDGKPDWKEEEDLRSDIQTYVGKIVSEEYPEAFNEGGKQKQIKFGKVHGQLNSLVGVESQSDMTVRQLREKKKHAKELLQKVKRDFR